MYLFIYFLIYLFIYLFIYLCHIYLFTFRFGECKVQVTVGDENDNSPKFTNLPNDTRVSEGAATNTAFFTVRVRKHRNKYVE